MEMAEWRCTVQLAGMVVEAFGICHYAKGKRSGVEGCGVQIRHVLVRLLRHGKPCQTRDRCVEGRISLGVELIQTDATRAACRSVLRRRSDTRAEPAVWRVYEATYDGVMVVWF